MKDLGWVCKEGGYITFDPAWSDITRFKGSAGYRFEIAGQADQPMRVRLLKSGEQMFLGLFTDISMLKNAFSSVRPLRIAVFSFSDIIHTLSAAPGIIGILINPDTQYHCFIARRDLGLN